jgi:hypothetical protein
MTSPTAHVQTTPSHKTGHQHPKHEMDITTTPQPQPPHIPTHHCTVFKQPQTHCTSATLAPTSTSITLPKWTNTQRENRHPNHTTGFYSPANSIHDKRSRNQQPNQQRNARLTLKQPHPSSNPHPRWLPSMSFSTQNNDDPLPHLRTSHLTTSSNANHSPNMPSHPSPRHAKIKQKTSIYQQESTRVKLSPTLVPTSKTTTKTMHTTVSIFNPALNTHKPL